MAIVLVRHYCPCCGYGGLDGPAYADLGSPPWLDFGHPPYSSRLGLPSYDVCACCGFEYGFDDEPGAGTPSSFEEYRAEWLSSGAKWFDPSCMPAGWDLREQLSRIGVAIGV